MSLPDNDRHLGLRRVMAHSVMSHIADTMGKGNGPDVVVLARVRLAAKNTVSS